MNILANYGKSMKNIFKSYRSELTGSILCLILGMLSGFVSGSSNSQWYTTLYRPWFTPPSWVFGPVWTILYLMMGFALGIIWNKRAKRSDLLLLFITQLMFNLLWSPLFFYFHRVDLAFYDISALWLSIAALIYVARTYRSIVSLLIPYFCWVSFASLINLHIYLYSA